MRSSSKLPFIKGIDALDLRVHFVAFCKAGATTSQVSAWVAKRPKLAEIANIPKSFKTIRKTLGCPAPRGGKRPSGKQAYRVSGLS